MLAVKDNPPTLADSIRDFFKRFKAAPGKTPHSIAEAVEKDRCRLETRRCDAFDPLDYLPNPEKWPSQNLSP